MVQDHPPLRIFFFSYQCSLHRRASVVEHTSRLQQAKTIFHISSCSRRSTDRTPACGAGNVGSIPTESTRRKRTTPFVSCEYTANFRFRTFPPFRLPLNFASGYRDSAQVVIYGYTLRFYLVVLAWFSSLLITMYVNCFVGWGVCHCNYRAG